MPRPKRITEAARLSVVLSKQYAEHIRLEAIKMSSATGRQVTVSSAIRSAIESAYPLPKDDQSDSCREGCR